jgi:D-proline reductase (dithiol) PrdB
VTSSESSAFSRPPALRDARVAIVTTAALHREDQEAWHRKRDQSFRVLGASDRALRLGHYSPNFDRVAIAADLNVVYPIDRLEEMAAGGVIGSVAPHHLSFMGAQDETMSTIRLDTGPAAAKLLREDGVDVVLLTPV